MARRSTPNSPATRPSWPGSSDGRTDHQRRRPGSRDEWFWSTRDIDRSDLYDPGLIEQEATWPVPDYVAIAQVGHGVNSYFMTYQAVFGPVALFAQTGWGVVYMDGEEQTAELAAQFEAIAKVLDLAESWPEIARVGHRLLVAESADKGIDICTWLELDGRGQPGLGSLQRLDPGAPDMGGASRDTVDVAVEMEWEEIGPVELVDGALVFPAELPKQPGLYRFRFLGPDGERFVRRRGVGPPPQGRALPARE